ncbi:MAG: hypothetical protein DRP51_00400 [Candidatus Zixiibacteriota bacterium]|nr:MAG: hypothetical protein DRP51_00400 [candidate division Zixibacteria bacterium]
MSRLFFISIAICFLALLTSGCYTILQHPSSEANYTAENYQADCLECHADYHEYPYGYFYGQYPDYWWSTPRWGRYYAYPWWWDNYWYDGSYRHTRDYSDDEPSPRSTRGKKVERRDVLRPPYSVGTTNLSRSGSSGNVGTSGSTEKPSDQNKQPVDNPDNTKTKEKIDKKEKKDNKKATRRGGRR